LRLINKEFNILRADTALPSALVLALFSALPPVSTSFYPGLLLAAVITGISLILFTTFGRPRSGRRRVFLMFTILSGLGTLSTCFLYYIPLLLIGCIQMRTFSLKTLLAAILGVLTPPWILIGSGLLSLESFRLPSFEIPALEADNPFSLTLLAVTAITIITGLMFLGANMIKVYAYNSKGRAMNGFYSILLLGSVLLTIIDFNNLILYVPLIMTMTAYQASHFFAQHQYPLSWIGIAVFLLACWGADIWYTLFLPL
ncbi:MAG: hypothetical protein K2G40_01300, partial [Muribaculaceae bacterium]|nr:hypothetical protein [Muribaculaceae bacterium]